jgi:nucleolar protein 58|tara:strand:- start:128 stop:1486 length:1359 start_codon:yes stop_codon:yes gene_type:complete
MVYVLFETPGGFALFKVIKDGKLKDPESLHKSFKTAEGAEQVVKLKAFKKFKDTKDAMKSVEKLIEGKMSKTLQKFLEKNIVQKEIEEELMVADKKLSKTITEKLGITCKHGEKASELLRCIRFQMESLLTGLDNDELKQMQLGLAHSVSRYQLSFTSEKVDTMIIQAVNLLEDLDKELNNYAMRLREWYGWHFPELGKIITDNVTYAQAVILIGMRTTVKNLSIETLAEVMDEEIAENVKEAAEVSMGTEILAEDEKHLKTLAKSVVEISDYRANLAEYLKNRMAAVAPNLTILIGELVAAKLIAHSGSLMNLAKQPASTIQILGAEKALFRALKTKKNTPKYGLIYNASVVGQAKTAIKGKISRTLANKCALCVRYDALGEDQDGKLGSDSKVFMEKRLKLLESGGQVIKAFSGNANGQKKHEAKSDSKGYSNGADFVKEDGAPSKRQRT